jgi:hypothetical protein
VNQLWPGGDKILVETQNGNSLTADS